MVHLPPITLLLHCVRDLDESGDIGTRQQTGQDVAAAQVLPGVFAACVQADLRHQKNKLQSEIQ